jgi:hypothetical protein
MTVRGDRRTPVKDLGGLEYDPSVPNDALELGWPSSRKYVEITRLAIALGLGNAHVPGVRAMDSFRQSDYGH